MRPAGIGGGIGARLAPPRYIAFVVILLVGCGIGIPTLGWNSGLMAGFDLAALGFLLSCIPLLDDDAAAMRDAAARNDANRGLLLVITTVVLLAVLTAVAGEIGGRGPLGRGGTLLVVGTLALAWAFTNIVYALHYAHLFYSAGADGDAGGLDVPGTDTPAYWDFVYFAVTLGMTFQTSDVTICTLAMRRVVIAHCLAAFVFNIGVLAFSINVLGGS